VAVLHHALATVGAENMVGTALQLQALVHDSVSVLLRGTDQRRTAAYWTHLQRSSPFSLSCILFLVRWVVRLCSCYRVAATAVGFRNLCRCGHGQLDHSIYGGQNAHVLTVAVGGGSGGGGGGGGSQQLCRSVSARSFTYSTKI